MFFSSPHAVVNAALGVLGIGFALLRRGRRGLVSRLMIGSGVVLLLPLGLRFAAYPLVFLGEQRLHYSLSVTVSHLFRWLTWPAYALLFFGFVFLTIARRRSVNDTTALPAAEEPLTAPRRGKAAGEAALGGVVAAITGGLIGARLGHAIGGTWSDSAEGQIVMGMMCGVVGIAAGLVGGVAGVLRAYRSDVGARRRFWFTVLASLFGVLLVVPLWTSAAGSLMRGQAWQYYYRKCCIDFPAGVLPLICGMLGYLLGLRSNDPASRNRPAYRRRRLVAGFVLLAVLASATLPFIVCGTRQSTAQTQALPVLPAFLRYPGARGRSVGQVLVDPAGTTGTVYHFDTNDSTASVLDFYRKTLVGWDSLATPGTSTSRDLTYGSRDGKEFVRIICHAAGPSVGRTSFTLIRWTKNHPNSP